MAKLLLVDDSAENIAVLKAILAGDGHEVEAIEDPALVFNTIFRFHPHLILCDVMMPGVDGVMLTRMLKRLDTTQGIPVLLCSALSESDLAERCKACGADGYVRKAALPTEIRGSVRRALRVRPPPSPP
ncbi:MAG: response regulator [Polyangiaceae bacterium]